MLSPKIARKLRDRKQQAGDAPSRSKLGWVVAPVIVFAAIAIVFAYALKTGDPSKLPSALIGKKVPETNFPALAGLTEGGKSVPGFTSAELADGEVKVVNFWASWCGPCIQEHPHLVDLAKNSSAKVLGVNYKDKPDAARRFLGRYGNPYAAVGTDESGRNAIEWGVYGMPETFVVNAKGEIVYKHVGPISAQSLAKQVMPAIEAARAEK